MIELLACADCGAVQQPRRPVCHACLSDRLVTRAVADEGELLATTRIHRSLDPAFASRLPVAIGTVKLAAGPVIFAFLSGPARAGTRVRVTVRENRFFAGD